MIASISIRRAGVLWLARLGLAVAVLLMAGWNAYISLRLRPDLPTVVINAAFWLVPILVPLVLTGQVWRSITLGTAVTFLLQRLHWLKWKYLEQTWTVSDLRLVVDRGNWILLRQYPEIPGYLFLGLAVLGTTWFLASGLPRLRWKWRGLSALLCALLVTGVVQVRHAHGFDPFGFSTFGHFASLVYSGSTLIYNPPVVDGDSALFVAKARAIPSANAITADRPADIVIWLQESAMDLALFDVPGLPSLAMYAPDATTRAEGRLRVHTWGGNTWLSEFALLGGISSHDFGDSSNGVYYTVTPKLRYSLPRLLKQSGYRAVALSGSPKGIYNMESAQRDLGFDEVLNPLDFPSWGGKALADNLISDAQLGEYAMQVLSRPRDHPMLLFVLSIMQHGPYHSSYPVKFGLDRGSLDRGLAARLSDFSDRMVATSDANRAMSAALLARGNPVVFAYFGDHQPNLGGAPPYVGGLTEPHFLTSFAIKSNVSAAISDAVPEVLDVSFLGAMVLQYANVPLDAFFAANHAMRQLCDGRLAECPDRDLTRSYRAHLYGDLRAATGHE